eukprot:Em0003g201a
MRANGDISDERQDDGNMDGDENEDDGDVSQGDESCATDDDISEDDSHIGDPDYVPPVEIRIDEADSPDSNGLFVGCYADYKEPHNVAVSIALHIFHASVVDKLVFLQVRLGSLNILPDVPGVPDVHFSSPPPATASPSTSKAPPKPYRFTVKNITRELSDVVDWKDLGIKLNLDPATLVEIKHNCHGMIGDCRQAMVEFWVNSDTSASWKRLAAALEGISQYAKAQEVRELGRKEVPASYSSSEAPPSVGKAPSPTFQVLSGKHHTQLLEMTRNAADRWLAIGIELGFKNNELDDMLPTSRSHLYEESRYYGDEMYYGDDVCYAAMLKKWLDWEPPNHSPPTLSALVAAMHAVGMERVAYDLERWVPASYSSSEAPPSVGKALSPAFQVLSGKHHTQLLEMTRNAADRWLAIGIELGFKNNELDDMLPTSRSHFYNKGRYYRDEMYYGDEIYYGDEMCYGDEVCYAAMLRRWLDWAPPNHSPPTLSALVAAMRAVGIEGVAFNLELRGQELTAESYDARHRGYPHYSNMSALRATAKTLPTAGKSPGQDSHGGYLMRWSDWAPPKHELPSLGALAAAVCTDILANELELQRKELYTSTGSQTSESILDAVCSNDEILKIAQLPFDWRRVGQRLIGDQCVADIESEEHDEKKRKWILLTWLKLEGSRATYKHLVEVLEGLGYKETAEEVTRLVRREGGE